MGISAASHIAMILNVERFAMDELNPTNPLNLNAQASSSKSLWRSTPAKLPVDRNLELVIGIYREEETSKWVLKALERLQRERAVALVSTAVLIKNQKGQLLPRQIVDWNVSEGGLIDGLTAALVSLFNPVGELGAIPFNSGGLAVEVLVDNLAEIGLTYEELTTFAKEVGPQSSILIALTKRPWMNRLMVEMAHTDARLIHKSILSSLRTQLGEHFINLAQAVTQDNPQTSDYFFNADHFFSA